MLPHQLHSIKFSWKSWLFSIFSNIWWPVTPQLTTRYIVDIRWNIVLHMCLISLLYLYNVLQLPVATKCSSIYWADSCTLPHFWCSYIYHTQQIFSIVPFTRYTLLHNKPLICFRGSWHRIDCHRMVPWAWQVTFESKEGHYTSRQSGLQLVLLLTLARRFASFERSVINPRDGKAGEPGQHVVRENQAGTVSVS